MNRHDDKRDQGKLEEVVRIVRSGHEFFVNAYAGLSDAQLRTGFAYIIDVKSQCLVDIAPWVCGEPIRVLDPDSPVVAIERIYADASRTFSGRKPIACASELGFGEAQLLRLTKQAYEATSDIKLKRLLKGYFPQFVICREAMWRLNSRLAA